VPLPDVLIKMLKTVDVKEGQVFDATNLRKAWAKACVAAGLGSLEPIDKSGNQRYNGLIIHDLRRSAVRNMMKAGVQQAVAMRVSGHTTNHIFQRYNIIAEDPLHEAMERVEAEIKS
jgi:integrase